MLKLPLTVIGIMVLSLCGCNKRLLPGQVPPAKPPEPAHSDSPASQSEDGEESVVADADGPQVPGKSLEFAESEFAESSEFDRQLAALRAGESSRIYLVSEPLTADGVKQLAGESQLLDLLLDAGGPSDADLAIIGKLANLEHLRIRKSQISDAGIESLCDASHSQLQILNLPQARITAVGIRHLSRLQKLTNLRLGGKQIDDAAASAVAQLPKLKSLHLIGPSLTAAGLGELAGAPHLASLYIDDCELPDAAWEQLFAAKPDLHVHIDQQHHDRDPKHHEHN